MIHVEKVEMRVYCDNKAETNVCTHGCSYNLRKKEKKEWISRG